MFNIVIRTSDDFTSFYHDIRCVSMTRSRIILSDINDKNTMISTEDIYEMHIFKITDKDGGDPVET